ncbi:hypothetical protein [Wolbachia endosymbiont (group A) of Bibio marci]|uniref:hypothetical protein n=1 Tax=Wolbachia endosymbiont (group A) of Bibio marci TaxID=2953987 RepID=UPI002231A975|nr:hypothetical protein [Wolbachia endosymbiont (group A) of Bibio marci]
MVAGLSFKKQDKTTDATALSEVKLIALEDKAGNKYTLDITTNDLKLEYKPTR